MAHNLNGKIILRAGFLILKLGLLRNHSKNHQNYNIIANTHGHISIKCNRMSKRNHLIKL